MLDHDAEESRLRVLITLSSSGEERIDLARALKVMQEPNNRIATRPGQKMRTEFRFKFRKPS